MAVLCKWLVYCIEEAIDVPIWSATEPTQCPNIHTDRAIDPNRIRVIDSRSIVQNVFVKPMLYDVVSPTYQLIYSFDYIANKTILWQLRINSRLMLGTSYDVKIEDVTHSNVLAEVNFVNTNHQSNNLGTLSNVPKDDAEIVVSVKVNGPDTLSADICGLNFLFVNDYS